MKTLNRFEGRRRVARREGEPRPHGMQVGDFWKVLAEDCKPKIVHHAGKLTEECWRAVVPIGDEDGSISVLPNDGSSNSILVSGSRGRSWHGYIYSGEFREIG